MGSRDERSKLDWQEIRDEDTLVRYRDDKEEIRSS